MTIDIRIELPFTHDVSPDAPAAHARSLSWMREMELADEKTLRYFAAMRMAEFAARWWPRARAADLDLLAELVCWLSLHDDEADSKDSILAERAKQTCTDLLDAVNGVDSSSENLARREKPCAIARAWLDLWTRMQVGMSESWRVRNADYWRQYFKSKVEEQDRDKLHASVDAYIEHRFQANAMQIFLGAGERVYGIEVDDHITNSPLGREALYESAFLAHVINDVVSVEREHARGEVQNAVLVLGRTRSCSLEEAVALTCDEVNRHAIRFAELEGPFRDWVRAHGREGDQRAAESWFDNMRSIARGTLDLHDSDRYTPAGAAIATAAQYAPVVP